MSCFCCDQYYVFQLEIWTHIPQDIHHYKLFFYNKGQIFIPNPQIYGSDMIRIHLTPDDLSAQNGLYHVFKQDFRLTQTHWKAIDTEKQKCDDKYTSTDEKVDITACIVDYLEGLSNCSMGLMGSKTPNIRFVDLSP